MLPLLNSNTKSLILCSLLANGGRSGRVLARQLNSSPTPIFKALRQLAADQIVVRRNGFYVLNTQNPYYAEITKLILKYEETEKNFLPKIPDDRKIDVLSVLKLKAMLGGTRKYEKFSDVLMKKYG